jgi:glycosyltransferase involved in cell wall biosynthesis
MKIVHFAKFYPPEYGGIESVTEALAEDHAAAGHDVEVVCFTSGDSRVERRGSLTLRRVKMQAKKSSQPLAMGYLGACARAARDADVVHVHTPNVLASLAVLRVPRAIPVVIHWHADIEGKGALGYVVRPVERAMLRRADKIIATTEAYAKASPALTPFKDRIEVIPIGIADQDCVPGEETGARPFVLFVGRLVPYKGLPVLLDAIRHVQEDAIFRIVGVGPEEAALKAQAREMGITDRLQFMGRVDSDRLQMLFSGAALFCLPSVNRLEAFGVVLLEAMRAGRAIISTDIPGSGVSWVNTTGAVVPVGDSKALAKALDKLLANPEQAAQMGRAARARFEREFLRQLMSTRFLDLYQRLIEQDKAEV